MKKGFTLIEMLSVIVILAVIFMFVFPKISTLVGLGEDRNKSIIENIIIDAAKEYSSNDNMLMNGLINSGDNKCIEVQTLVDKGFIEEADLEKISSSLSSKVKVELNSSDNLEYTIVTSCEEHTSTFEAPALTLATTYFTNLCNNTTGCNDASNTSGLIKTNGTELRYRGSNPDNYVTFNGEEAGWRIVGVFDVSDGTTIEKRVKLVKDESIGSYAWDTSASTINSGYGINQWGPSSTYTGADLMRELNTDYLNKGTGITMWFSGQSKTVADESYDLSKGLSAKSISLIDNAVWYLGAGVNNLTLEAQYKRERGIGGFVLISNPTDGITRTTSWTGKVGLIYPSDYGYATSNGSCKDNLHEGDNCKVGNWLYTGNVYWTISPVSSYAHFAQFVYSTGIVGSGTSYRTSDSSGVRPSVYLKSGVNVYGEGTPSKPFIFTN